MKLNIKVNNPNEWKKYFPPAGGEKQWKDGYSALEFAKIVTGDYKEDDFEKKLQEVFGKSFSISHDEVFPERLSRFDNRSGPRHHDLACCAELNGKRIALCFEAKVYETLDKTLEKYRISKGQMERCDELCELFFGKKYSEEFKDVYFQLLSSVAGTIAFAAENGISDAYFVLYQINPSKNNREIKNKDKHIAAHKKALNDFIKFAGFQETISKSGNKTNLKEFAISRKDKGGKLMKANISVVYIEHEVLGAKLE